jgi:hypothetical protein
MSSCGAVWRGVTHVSVGGGGVGSERGTLHAFKNGEALGLLCRVPEGGGGRSGRCGRYCWWAELFLCDSLAIEWAPGFAPTPFCEAPSSG